MLVGLFSGTARVAVGLIAVRAGLPPHTFTDVRRCGLRRISQLRAMDQRQLPVAEEPVDLVGDGSGNFENAKLGHGSGWCGAVAPAPSLHRAQTHFAARRSTSFFTLLSRSSSRARSRSSSRVQGVKNSEKRTVKRNVKRA